MLATLPTLGIQPFQPVQTSGRYLKQDIAAPASFSPQSVTIESNRSRSSPYGDVHHSAAPDNGCVAGIPLTAPSLISDGSESPATAYSPGTFGASDLAPASTLPYVQQVSATDAFNWYAHGQGQALYHSGLSSTISDSSWASSTQYPCTFMPAMNRTSFDASTGNPWLASCAASFGGGYTYPERPRMVRYDPSASPSGYCAFGESSSSPYGIPDSFIPVQVGDEYGVAPMQLDACPVQVAPSVDHQEESRGSESPVQDRRRPDQRRQSPPEVASDDPTSKRGIQTAEERNARDEILLHYRNSGLSYKEIKNRGGFTEAESTLRGRMRVLSKPKHERVRKPKWYSKDVSDTVNCTWLATR